jgi:hypothetical protein
VQLALFGMLVLLIAWFGGERLIVRPIRALVLTAARFGRGDLHVRAGDEPWLAEFQPLAAALDDMAHKLAGREEELRVANQHLEALASLDGLTGLAEYRNGGLFVDAGVLRLRNPQAAIHPNPVGSPLVVEWRALTVALLDRLADMVRKRLGRDATSFPLAKVLQGGTWAAGREVARALRADGSPPIKVVSDGTVI